MEFKHAGKYYVYIVECQDGTYYTGYTRDLKNRIQQHNNGKRGAIYTRYKRPVKLVYAKEYKYHKLAVQEECRIKTLRRRQKERLINGSAKLKAAEKSLAKFTPKPNRQRNLEPKNGSTLRSPGFGVTAESLYPDFRLTDGVSTAIRFWVF